MSKWVNIAIWIVTYLKAGANQHDSESNAESNRFLTQLVPNCGSGNLRNQSLINAGTVPGLFGTVRPFYQQIRRKTNLFPLG